LSNSFNRTAEIMSDLCFEYFDCKKKDCPNRKEKRIDCWNVAHKVCPQNMANIGNTSIPSESVCKMCLYYKYIHENKLDK
jgi:hypothetical protein